MLPLQAKLDALRRCETEEVFWTPAHPRSILAIGLFDEGDSGGVFVPSSHARHKYQALVLAVNDCRYVQAGDLVVFDVGRGEELRTARGEIFFHITEPNVAGVDESFLADAKEKIPTQRPSGLWVLS